MATPPVPLQQGTNPNDAYSLINLNFNNAAQTINDLGVKTSTSTIVTFTNKTGTFNSSVSLLSLGATPLSTPYVQTQQAATGLAFAEPVIDIYMTTDADPNFLYPYGSSIASPANSFVPMMQACLTPAVGALATVVIGGWNFSTTPYTYYFHIQFGYIPVNNTVFK